MSRLIGMHGQVVGAVADEPECGRVLGHPGVRLAQHDVEPDAQLALVDGLLVELDLGPADAGVRDAGQPLGQAFLVGQLDDLELLGLFILGRARRFPAGQRGVPSRPWAVSRKAPMGRPCGVLDDLAAPRIGGFFRYARHLHGLGVGQGGVPAGVGQDDRVGRARPGSRPSWIGRPSTLGSGLRSHFSWCQPRPMIGSPGLAFRAAAPTRATMSSQLRAFVRSRLSLDSPRPVKMHVGVDPARAWPAGLRDR